MTRQRQPTAADIRRAEEMAELLNSHSWTLDQYLGPRGLWGRCPKGHLQKFTVTKLRGLKRGPKCDTCKPTDFPAEMADLLKTWGWTLDTYANSEEVWGLCPNNHRKQFEAGNLRNMKRGPVCDTCVAAEMADLLKKWGWTFDEYGGSVEAWGLCPNGHRKKFKAANLRRMTRGPVCDTCQPTDFPAEMAELLDTWGWTLDEYVNAKEVYGLCPNKHRKKFRATHLRKMKREPRCPECR